MRAGLALQGRQGAGVASKRVDGEQVEAEQVKVEQVKSAQFEAQ
jgi:hypothetical protein